MVHFEPEIAARGVSPARADLTHVDSDRELFSEAEWGHLKAALTLTARQCEVARLMCAGFGYEAIAFHMGISINTVRMHMRALFAKLGVHDRVSALLQLISAERGQPSVVHGMRVGP